MQYLTVKKIFITTFISISLLCCLSAVSNATENKNTLSDSLRTEALELLRTHLQTLSGWEKVHAAEYLLWLGYPQDVYQTFEAEHQKLGSEVPYRIGIWRVLAQASPTSEERKIWTDKIVRAFLDKEGKDRIHAVESLAKLKASPYETDSVLTLQAMNGEGALSLYTHWASLYTSSDVLPKNFDYFIELLRHEDVQLRRIAAYVLRHAGNLSAKEWNQLIQFALTEPDSSAARPYLLSAALVKAPYDSVADQNYLTVRKKILQINSLTDAGQAEVMMALAAKGTHEDIPTLTHFLHTTTENQADLRSAAAYAILSIHTRQGYSLSTLDWVVIAIYLMGMLGIGYLYSLKNKDEKDFLLGGGNMNPIAVGLSLFATLLSSLSYLSYPGETIKYGPVIFTGLVTFPLVYYVVGWFLIPKFMALKVTSAYEILEIRLGISVRMLATFFFLSLRFLWMATIIYVTVNTAILTLFDLPSEYTLPISILLMLITIVYTSMGGLKAVVATDVVQSAVLLGGALVAIIAVSIQYDSITAWIPTQWLPQWGEFKWGIDARERLTFGNAVIMVFIWQVCSAGSDQMAIQRYLATKDVKAARKTFGISLLTNMIAQLLLGLVGIAMIAFFVKAPHYLPSGNDIYQQADLLFPRFVLVGLPVGLSGLIVAGIFAAAMSSLSSGLNSTSSVISEDLLKRFTKKHQPINQALKQVKMISMAVGVFTLLLSIVVSKVEGNLYDIIVKVVNLFVTPLFVLFFLALFVPFATARGTLLGGIFSLAMAIAVAFFGFLGIEVLFITPMALVTGIFSGVISSYIDHKLLGNPETVANRKLNSKTSIREPEETEV